MNKKNIMEATVYIYSLEAPVFKIGCLNLLFSICEGSSMVSNELVITTASLGKNVLRFSIKNTTLNFLLNNHVLTITGSLMELIRVLTWLDFGGVIEEEILISSYQNFTDHESTIFSQQPDNVASSKLLDSVFESIDFTNEINRNAI
jgi:hypothetical protein